MQSRLLLSLLVVMASRCLACSGAEPARPYAAEIDPASPEAQEPDYVPPSNPLKQRVVPSAKPAAVRRSRSAPVKMPHAPKGHDH